MLLSQGRPYAAPRAAVGQPRQCHRSPRGALGAQAAVGVQGAPRRPNKNRASQLAEHAPRVRPAGFSLEIAIRDGFWRATPAERPHRLGRDEELE